jgi:Leucine rich repeat
MTLKVLSIFSLLIVIVLCGNSDELSSIFCQNIINEHCSVVNLKYELENENYRFSNVLDESLISVDIICDDEHKNEISFIPKGIFGKFNKGKSNSFKIAQCEKLSSIKGNSFADGACLKTLSITNTSLKTIAARSFKQMDGLVTLNLSYNKLKEIYNDTFAGLGSLQKLDLSHNQIEVLPLKLFNSTPNVVSIDLSHNQIFQVDPTAFEACTVLKNLDLRKNKCIDGIFNYSSIYINLKNCGITTTTTTTSKTTTTAKNAPTTTTLTTDVPTPVMSTTSATASTAEELINIFSSYWYYIVALYAVLDVSLSACIIVKRLKEKPKSQFGDELYLDLEYLPCQKNDESAYENCQ